MQDLATLQIVLLCIFLTSLLHMLRGGSLIKYGLVGLLAFNSNGSRTLQS